MNKLVAQFKKYIYDIKLLKTIIKNIEPGYKVKIVKNNVPGLTELNYSTGILTVRSTRTVIDIYHYFIIEVNEYYIILSQKEGTYEYIFISKYDKMKDYFSWLYMKDSMNLNNYFSHKLYVKLENKINKLMIDSELVENIIVDDDMAHFLISKIIQLKRNKKLKSLLN
jgi:hypothetical protein